MKQAIIFILFLVFVAFFAFFLLMPQNQVQQSIAQKQYDCALNCQTYNPTTDSCVPLSVPSLVADPNAYCLSYGCIFDSTNRICYKSTVPPTVQPQVYCSSLGLGYYFDPASNSCLYQPVGTLDLIGDWFNRNVNPLNPQSTLIQSAAGAITWVAGSATWVGQQLINIKNGVIGATTNFTCKTFGWWC